MNMNEIDLYKIGMWFFFTGLFMVVAGGLLGDRIPTYIVAEWVSWIWAVAATLMIGHFGGRLHEILKKRKENLEETEEKN